MTTKPLLTIGMAHHKDYDGVYFTYQALKMYHDMTDVQVVVVDNTPRTQEGVHVRGLIEHWNQGLHSTKYVPFEDSVGTTQTRQAVFDNADGEFVMVMDCHVLVMPDSIRRLKEFLKGHRKSKDIYSGPMLFDDLRSMATHFDMCFRGEMYGIWSNAIKCRHCDAVFSTYYQNEGRQVDIYNEPIVYKNIMTFMDEPVCSCGDRRPSLKVFGHETALRDMGYVNRARASDVGFETPGQGLGLFVMRRSAWPGFNPHMRGFGGEELYIHEKVRQRGGRSICLPWLQWNHRFARPGGVDYPLNRFDKIRNYVLTFQEVGWDLQLVYDYFVGRRLFSQYEWKRLVEDPINATPESVVHVPGSGGLETPQAEMNVDELLNWTSTRVRDLNEHLDTLAELSRQCDHVTEVTKRRESGIGLAAGRPEVLMSYTTETDPLLFHHMKRALEVEGARTELRIVSGRPTAIEETDLLFIDDQHNAEALSKQLNDWAPMVRKFLVFHDTLYHGDLGDNEGPGLWYALQPFLDENREWFIYQHHVNQYGLSVLSKVPELRPDPRIIAWPEGWGVGTELHDLLEKWLNISTEPKCKCRQRMHKMDMEGIEWCIDNQKLIIDWLQEEAERRKKNGTLKVPFTRTGASVILKGAIHRAKKTRKRRKAQGLDVH